MQAVRRRIRAHVDQHPHLRAQRDLLTSIPGIGDATAAVLLAEFGPLGRFRQARAVAAFAGSCPVEGRSGTSVRRHPCLSKLGAPAFRKALFFPAIIALRCNPIAQRLQSAVKGFSRQHSTTSLGFFCRLRSSYGRNCHSKNVHVRFHESR